MNEEELKDKITGFWEDASDEYTELQEELLEEYGIEEVGRTDPNGKFKVETEEHTYRVDWANRQVVEYDGEEIVALAEQDCPEEFEQVQAFVAKLYDKVAELNQEFVNEMEENGFEVVEQSEAHVAFSDGDVRVSTRPWVTDEENINFDDDFEAETGVDPSSIEALMSAEINSDAIIAQLKQYLKAFKNGRIQEEQVDRKISELVENHSNIKINTEYEMADLRSEGMPIRRNTYHDALTVVHDYEVGKFVMFGDQSDNFEDVDGQRVLGVVELPKEYSEYTLHAWDRQDDKALDKAEEEILEYMDRVRWEGIKEHGENALQRLAGYKEQNEEGQ